MRRRKVGLQIFGVVILGLVQLASAQSPWSGSVQCQLATQSAEYAHQETQTWAITAAPPSQQGAFEVYQATWSSSAQGRLQKILGPQALAAQWNGTATGISAPMAVAFRPADNQLVIKLWHAQLHSPGALRISRQTQVNGAAPSTFSMTSDLWEWPLPPMQTTGNNSNSITGSGTQVISGGLLPQHTPSTTETINCTWQFTRGDLAKVPVNKIAIPANVVGPSNPAGGLVSTIAPANPTISKIQAPPSGQQVDAAPVSVSTTEAPGGLVATTHTLAVNPSSLLPPGISNMRPPSLTRGLGNVDLRITGNGKTHFSKTSKVDIGQDIFVTVDYAEANTIVGRLEVLSGADTGPRTVTVTTGSEVIKMPNGFNVTQQTTSGTYSVYIDEFDAVQQTNSASTNGGDQIYLDALLYPASRQSCVMPNLYEAASKVFGNISGHPERIQAGTATPTGGLITGNKVSLLQMEDSLEVWGGTLSDGQDIVIIIPTIWASHGDTILNWQWRNNIHTYSLISQNQCLAEIAAPGINIIGPTSSNLLGSPGDFPIGMSNYSCPGCIAYYDKFLILSREKIEWWLNHYSTTANFGQTAVGTLPITFTSDAATPSYANPGGTYTIYLHIIRLLPND